MSTHHKSDAEIIATTHNVARFFTEHRQVALILLLATFVWGWYGYHHMPKRKDPDIPVRVAAAQCQWPGATAEQVEQLVTRPMEQAVAQNTTIRPPSPSDFGIRSHQLSRARRRLHPARRQREGQEKQFTDINLKLNQLNSQLPRGAGPIQFNSNFGDTAALMLTVASPKVDADGDSRLRAIAIRKAIEATRAAASQECAAAARQRHLRLPAVGGAGPGAQQSSRAIADIARRNGTLKDLHFFEGPGYVGLDASTSFDDETIRARGEQLIQQQPPPLRASTRTRGSRRSSAIRPDTEAELQRSPARSIPIASSTTTPT